MGNYETCQTDSHSEWNGAAANELCGKKGIWREDMNGMGEALFSDRLLTRLPRYPLHP